MGDLLQKLLAMASFVPGPQQPFVIGANMARGLGQHAYRRAHDDQYRRSTSAFMPGPIAQAGLSVLTNQVDPIRMLLQKLRGGVPGGLEPGDWWDRA